MTGGDPRWDAGGPVPDDWPRSRPSFFQSDLSGLLLGVAGSVLLVAGVWLWESGRTLDAVAALTLAALGILSGALTFRRGSGGGDA